MPPPLAFRNMLCYGLFMFTYRGKVVTEKDIGFIRELIARNPGISRWALSRELCRQWNWVQQNGALRDVVCRGMMLELHRAGHIQLPEKKRSVRNPLVDRQKPRKVRIDQHPLQTKLSDLKPLEFRQVHRSADEKLFVPLRRYGDTP